MKLRCSWRNITLAVLLYDFLCPSYPLYESLGVTARGLNATWTGQRKLLAREKTKELWKHGYSSYMRFAFPMDELTPLSCTGRGPDWYNPHNFGHNDVAGNFSLTLIDVLDTFVVLDDKPGFEAAVLKVIKHVQFDVNTKPQVFEVTIRVLGGLLSAHIFASDPHHPFYLPWYKGELLELAHDLGRRLLPAFMTPTGLPFARLNLRYGVPIGESIETCTAGAGSLILEFATLSRLTGDDRFEKAAFKAFFALWNRRSDIGLVGNTINLWSGGWIKPEVTGVGAGIDSFYEYALKWYILSGEVEFLDVWHEAYAAIMRYSRGSDGFWFRTVNIHTGDIAYSTSDSLSAFWPGLQVLAGDVESAIKSHLIFWNIWKRNSGLPEVWDINFMQATSTQYPLRPEFIESTYYLYRATKDPFYLEVGERVLRDLTLRAKVECGLTGIMDLRTNQRDDRMESFVLSETLKYLYLLFDESNPLHKDDSNFVFTTEGHILKLNSTHLKPPSSVRRKLRRVENLQCPAYRANNNDLDDFSQSSTLLTGIRSRPDTEYARALVGAMATSIEEFHWSPDGYCEMPNVQLYSYDFILSARGDVVAEDVSPNAQKLAEVDDGFILQNVTGIRTHIVSRLDGKGYDIVKLGPHAVRSGQIVYVNDTELFLKPADATTPSDNEDMLGGRPRDLQLLFFLNSVDPTVHFQPGAPEAPMEVLVNAYTAMFGGDATKPSTDSQGPSFGRGHGSRVVRIPGNDTGCKEYKPEEVPPGVALLMLRGGCTFIEKLVHAAVAGASGIVVVSDEDDSINPSADRADIDAYREIIQDVPLLLIPHTSGVELLRLVDAAEIHDFAVMVVVDPMGDTGLPPKGQKEHDRKNPKRNKNGEHRLLYLNGHPLMNTRLLV